MMFVVPKCKVSVRKMSYIHVIVIYISCSSLCIIPEWETVHLQLCSPHPPNFVEQTLKDGRSSLIILVVEKYLNLSNNVYFNGKGNRSGQKQDIFG